MSEADVVIEKPRAPKGRSYVVASSLLITPIRAAGIDCQLCLTFRPDSRLPGFDVYYWAPNENIAYPRIAFFIGTVPAQQRRVVLDKLAAVGIPAVVQWLKALVALPENSPTWFASEKHMSVRFDGQDLSWEQNPKL
jgi:hypothetical protein